MVAKPNTRMQEATCDQLLLLAVFGDDAMRSRGDAELDRRARLRPFMSAAPPAPSAARMHVESSPPRSLRLPTGSPALAG